MSPFTLTLFSLSIGSHMICPPGIGLPSLKTTLPSTGTVLFEPHPCAQNAASAIIPRASRGQEDDSARLIEAPPYKNGAKGERRQFRNFSQKRVWTNRTTRPCKTLPHPPILCRGRNDTCPLN